MLAQQNNVAKITTLRTEVKDQSLLSLIGLRVGWVTPMGGNLERNELSFHSIQEICKSHQHQRFGLSVHGRLIL